MQQRIDIRALEPASYQAMVALERNVASAGLDERTRHLVKLRASFLNGCAYCIDMHSAEGREAGIPETHLFGVAAWQEAPFFSDRERAALALTDAATHLRERRARCNLGGRRQTLGRGRCGQARLRDRDDQRLEPPRDRCAHDTVFRAREAVTVLCA
jgi:AhpD family alkylhydroperoxidase